MEGEELEQVERFTYLGSWISTNRNIISEITASISKAQAAFSDLRNLWRCKDVSLATKGWVYNATVRSTLLYGCETWLLRSGDLHRLQVFDHRFLRSIGHFAWKQRISNDEVRHRIFWDSKSSRKLNQIILGTHLRWLGHVLRMNSSRLPKKFLLAEQKLGWKRSRDGQVMTWHRGIKESTKRLATVGSCRLPSRGPKDQEHAWLNTLEEMTTNRCQWQSCCSFLVDPWDGKTILTANYSPFS